MKPQRAFTLIELLVVVSIIALLIAILLPSLARAREQAKLVKCGTNLKSISNAIVTYAANNNDIVIQTTAFYRNEIVKDPPVAPGKPCALLSWPESLALDGGVPYGFTSGHFSIMAQGIFRCPNADKDRQYGLSGAGHDGYGVNYFQRSHFQNTYSTDGTGNSGTINGAIPNPYDIFPNLTPIIKKMAALKPDKILAFEGYYSAGPGGTTQYWIYNRHFTVVTTTATTVNKYRGLSNYLFNDGHVEVSGTYLKQYPSALMTSGMSFNTASLISPFGGDPPYPP